MSRELKVLKSFIKQVRGVSYKPHQISDTPQKGFIALLRATNILENGIDLKNVIYVDGDLVKEEQILQEGDVLVAASSGSLKAVGKSSMFTGKGKFTFGAFCKVIRPIKIEGDYLKHFFNTKEYKRRINEQINGSNIKNIKNEHIDSLKLYIPDINQQKEVSVILNTAEKIIIHRKSQIVALDELTKSVFLEMFGDPMENPKNIQEEPLTDILIDIKGGGTPSKSVKEYYEGAIPWVTPKDMKRLYMDDSIDHINEVAIKNSSAKLIQKNSLLMVIRSGILKKHLPLAINTTEVAINQDMKALIPNQEKVYLEYLYMFFKLYERKILSKVRAVTADNINFNDIKNLLVPLPRIEEQSEFVKKFNEIQVFKRKLESQNECYINLYNNLLQKAFRGELFRESK